MKQAQLELCHAGMTNDTSDQLGLPQQHDLLCKVLGSGSCQLTQGLDK